MKHGSVFSTLLLIVAILGTISCSKDDDNSSSSTTGNVRFEITDAPIDDANVSAVFVTVADVQVDGQSVAGFSKTTIDLLAYQNGSTELLGNANLEAGSYSNVTLVLDFDLDANGNSPGCYVEEQGGAMKHKLESGSNTLTLAANLLVEADQQAVYVMDFDLRKCVQRESNQSDEYEFVSKGEMESGIRIVSSSDAGVINGTCSDMSSASDKIVVYAYKKGTFNRNTEVAGQGQSNVEFANAESSSQVDANGNYQLHFLEEGEYEVHYCSYEENATGEMELQGTLSVNILGSLNIGSINVAAQSSTTVNVTVTGLIPL